MWEPGEMLTSGIDHVATLTADSDRLQQFLIEMFDATVEFDGPEYPGGPRMTVINIGPHTELNVFEVDGNEEPSKQTPMFGRGRLDHIGYQAPSIEVFEEIRRRLMSGRATDGAVTDFGRKLSLFFRDPDAMECEVLVTNPTPGTRKVGSAVPEYEPVPLD
jgi:catechol 2,3-dioxygenase-like lactoylglutathione lyase family enzyme